MDQLRREVGRAAAGPAARAAGLARGVPAALAGPGGVGTSGGLRVRRCEP
jgi:hypothetical protein